MKSLILVFAFAVSQQARADKPYKVESLSIDEVVQGAAQVFSSHLRELREQNLWSREADHLLIEGGGCEQGGFTMFPSHSVIGGVVRDEIKFTSCGKAIGLFRLDRTGPGVKPMTDDELYEFSLPAPSGSETYDLKWTLYKFTVHSEATVSGRSSYVSYVIGSNIPMFVRFEDSEDTSGTFTRNRRRTRFEVTYDGQQKWVIFDQQKIRQGGSQASYLYRIESESKMLDVAPTAFRSSYLGNIESNTLGNFEWMFKYPGNGYP